MITEVTLQPIFTDIDPNYKTVSVLFTDVIYKDGVEISRLNRRRAFVPGQIDSVKDYIGIEESPEITYLNSIWTQEAIDFYNNFVSQGD